MRIWHQSFTDLTMVPLYSRTLVEHAAAATGADTEVTIHGLRPGTYGPDVSPIDTIRYRYLEFLNEGQVVEAARTAEAEGYDAVAVGCFFDPGLRQARSLVKIPVLGLAETCMLVACSIGHRFGLVTLNRDQQRHYREIVHGYGLERRFAGAEPMDPPIDEYSLEADERDLEPLVDTFERASQRLLDAGAEVIVPADGVLNEFVWRNEISRVGDATVLDAVGVLFRYAEFMVGAQSTLGLTVSRAAHYATPSATQLAHARAVAGVEDMVEEDFSTFDA